MNTYTIQIGNQRKTQMKALNVATLAIQLEKQSLQISRIERFIDGFWIFKAFPANIRVWRNN